MTPTEIHDGIALVREEVEHVREALDRTDAVLGVADSTLLHAEEAIAASRRIAPIVLGVAAVVAVGVVAVLVLRRRKARDEG